ncbi:ROK family protein [Actinomyces sp. 186855]|uniref:ROK family protein n=1 Tax=Actinomyces sp. 186855 TaxID=2761164 RepID=UPI00202E6F48
MTSATDAITDWPGTDIVSGVGARLRAAGVTRPDAGAPLIHVDNDVNAYAAGEAWIGAGAGARTALVVAVGTGVGGAVVLGGSVHHGAHYVAGEMGHMPSGLAGQETCTCGRPGHLEAVAAGPQIARRYREATGATDVTTALAVERLADAGDATAQRVYREAATALGKAIAQVVTVLDPDKIIISGGLARSGELWWGPLRETVAAELIDLVAHDTELLPATLGATAPIIGSAHEAHLRLARSS